MIRGDRRDSRRRPTTAWTFAGWEEIFADGNGLRGIVSHSLTLDVVVLGDGHTFQALYQAPPDMNGGGK